MSLMLNVCTLIAVLLALHWLVLMFRVLLRPQVLPLLPADVEEGADQPTVSILVAVRNEADRVLRSSLNSMLSQGYPEFEVIAVDDHSTDGTDLILNELAARQPKLRIIRAEEGRRGRRELCSCATVGPPSPCSDEQRGRQRRRRRRRRRWRRRGAQRR